MQLLLSGYKSIILVSSVIYVISLILLLLKKNDNEVHNTLRGVDASLVGPITAADLASECGLNNLKVALYDVHVFTHFAGWFITTLAFRDVAFSWVCGLLWEVVESSLEHNVTELRECWWDKLFMDLLGCNNLGILCAWLTLRYFKIEEYNWAQITTPDGSVLHKVSLLYFIPGRNTFKQNSYGLLKNARTCITFIYAHLVVIIVQSNLFFLKTALWIPTVHWIITFRTAILASLVLLSGEPVYKRQELTGFPLLLNMILALEGLLILRFGSSLLSVGKGDTLTINLIIASIFVFMILSLAGFTQLVQTRIKSIVSACCKPVTTSCCKLTEVN